MLKSNNIIKLFQKHKYSILLLILSWVLYFTKIFSKLIEFKEDGIYLGHENVWSDWALHISIVNLFAYKDPSQWFSYHPMYAGGKFTYTFLTNLISATLMRFGFSLKFSMIFPSIIFSIFLIFGIYVLFYLLTKSQKISLISLNIFFLSSGPGFFRFLQKYNFHPTWQNFINPPEHFSRLDEYAWYAGNFLVGMLIPQRSFLLGMPLALWSLILFIFIIENKKILIKKQKKLLFFGGLLAGILPIAHMHSFIFLVLTIGIITLFNLKKIKLLLFYILPAGILSTILYFNFIYGGIEISNFMKFMPGWSSGPHFYLWIKMWWDIWGFTLPVCLFGLYLILKSKNNKLKIFISVSFLIFILANLILLQPITWDNSKLFLWSYLGFSLACGFLIAKISQLKYFGIYLSFLLFILLTLTGVLEINRLWHTSRNQYLMTNTDDINLGLEIRKKTQPDDIFLTAADHNHFIMIWANRPIMMGFSPWVLNFGFNYQQREQDIRNIYEGKNTKNLIKKYNISYIVIGPSEKRNFDINENFFSRNFNLVFKNKTNNIYSVN